jgi:hypothetical protein
MFGLSFLTPTLLKWGGIALAVLAAGAALQWRANHDKE